MFAPGYHYYLQRSERPVARPPSKGTLFSENCGRKWQFSVIDCADVASGSVTLMSLSVKNFL